jgi:Tfp pilus assembly protein PilP
MVVISIRVEAKIEDIFSEMTIIPNPLKLRDPFLSPKFESQRVRAKKEAINTSLSNIPELGEVKLEELEIVGVIIGPNRRAFAKIKGKEGDTFVIKEGIRLGENMSVVKAILPGGIVLVEKNTNIYGEDEYLETVIPISK